MAYSMNILPKEAAYYTLTNASIVNGRLSLQAGGTAYIKLDKTRLANITKTILVNVYANKLLNPLTTLVTMYLDITLSTGEIQRVAIYPNQLEDKALSFPITLTDGDYTDCAVYITASIPCDLLVYELCPEQESDVTTIIEGVTQSLPHVLYDYNETAMLIEQSEDAVATIACSLYGNTDVNGHFLMNFYSTEQCDIYLRFYDNEIEELYAPLKYTVDPGHNSIGVPHAYLKRLEGVHTFVVTCQCTNGSLSIYTRGTLFTIDAGYLAERLIDAGMDMCDLTIKQVQQGEHPEELWACGVDVNTLLVKSRGYGTMSSTAWTPQYSLGTALTGAIEFNGRWVLRNNTIKYTIETEAQPYVFIVDSDHNLYVTVGNQLEDKLLLDTNVTQLSVVRGYKSEIYKKQDQGLIVAYIKNKQCYYRRYVYEEGLEDYYWEASNLLTEEEVEYVYVQRLNDFRIGFLTRQADGNYWYISDRTYVNQSMETQICELDILSEYTNLAVIAKDDADSFAGVEEPFEDPEGSTDTFIVNFKYPLIHRQGYIEKANYTLLVDNVSVPIKEIKISGNQLICITETPQTHQRYDNSSVIFRWSDYYLQLQYYTHYHLITSKDYTWTFIRPINNIYGTIPDELCDLDLQLNVNCAMVEVNKIKQIVPETINLLQIEPTLAMVPLNRMYHTVNENINLLQIEPTLSVILIGEKPI